MKLGGYLKLTLKDYPGHIAAICFTKGCLLRCPFCHNPDLVFSDNKNSFDEYHIEREFLAYLEKRKHQIEGVVISGGEPLQQKDIHSFLKEIRNKNLKIKLDTNGLFPDRLSGLIQAGLVDYVALDFKNTHEGFAGTVGLLLENQAKVDKHYDCWGESLELLRKSKTSYEIRTTVLRELHPPETLLEMANLLSRITNKEVKWYLQSYVKNGLVINDYTAQEKSLSAYSNEEMEEIRYELSSLVPLVEVRN